MAYPTQPAGTILPTWFGLQVGDSSWAVAGRPDCKYAYAIVPYVPQPKAWDSRGLRRPKVFTVSRAVNVESGDYYDDNIIWVGPTGNTSVLASTTALSDITNTIGWIGRQTQNTESGYNPESWFNWGNSFGVLEIIMWNDTESESYSEIGGFSIEFVCDEDFDTPGSSSVRQTIERFPLSGVSADNFASAYHIQWGLVEGLNRILYEDTHSNTWFLFETQDKVY